MVVFDKRSRPDNRGGFKQVYLLASLKTQRERRGSPGHTFPSGDHREAREHEGMSLSVVVTGSMILEHTLSRSRCWRP